MDSTLDLKDLFPSGIRRFTRGEYDSLVDQGLFTEERVELLRGVVVTMSPESERHASTVEWLTEHLILELGGHFSVRPGLPFATDDSEPKPDLYVGPRWFDESNRTPRESHPATALLLIEVSNTSLRKDRHVKTSIYAEAGVPEYWILIITDDDELVVEVYSEPTRSGYARKTTLRDGDVLRPLHLPLEIAVSDIPH